MMESTVSYLVACMLSSFTVGVMVGVLSEAASRNYSKRKHR